MRVSDNPVLMLFGLTWFGVGYETEALNLVVQPSNDALVEVCEVENVSRTMCVKEHPSVAIYQSAKQVGCEMGRYGLEYSGVSSLLELVPSEFLKRGCKGHGCDTEPCAAVFVVLLERVRTSQGRFEFGEMVLVSALQCDSEYSGPLISSANADVPVGEKKAEPVRLQFVVYVLEEGGIELSEEQLLEMMK
jgi:hypothetical protein